MSSQKTLRLDDIGASSKYFSQGGRYPFTSIGFLKRLSPFRRWGPYEEITAEEWKKLLAFFTTHKITPLIAITASWVKQDGTMIPFPQHFPEQAALLKQAVQAEQITIANHGLTHCVVGHHQPRFFSDNRTFHREFWPWVSPHVHEQHIVESQRILERWLGVPLTIFVPPGNVWSKATYNALKKTNLTTVICNRPPQDMPLEALSGITYIDDRKQYIVMHDRDVQLLGLPGFFNVLEKRLGLPRFVEEAFLRQ